MRLGDDLLKLGLAHVDKKASLVMAQSLRGYLCFRGSDRDDNAIGIDLRDSGYRNTAIVVDRCAGEELVRFGRARAPIFRFRLLLPGKVVERTLRGADLRA
jgi:hypothetical protein